MRVILCALLLVASQAFAAQAPLRFSIADSWAMPLVQIEDNQPRQGILYDMMSRLAQHLGRTAEFHVLARARVQSAIEHGEIDVRCYSAQSWVDSPSGNYLWSIPLLIQRDLLVGNPKHTAPVDPRQLPTQSIGTVLSYTYPTLQPLFDSGQLQRDDARSQEQVLEKLTIERSHYGVSNQWSLEWFNQRQAPERRLHAVAVLQEQGVGCYVRNDPSLPVQSILRTLLRMKMSGEIDDIVRRYIGHYDDGPPDALPPLQPTAQPDHAIPGADDSPPPSR